MSLLDRYLRDAFIRQCVTEAARRQQTPAQIEALLKSLIKKRKGRTRRACRVSTFAPGQAQAKAKGSRKPSNTGQVR